MKLTSHLCNLSILLTGALLCSSCKKQPDSTSSSEQKSPRSSSELSGSQSDASPAAAPPVRVKAKTPEPTAAEQSAYDEAYAAFTQNPSDVSALQSFLDQWPTGINAVSARNTVSAVYYQQGLLADYLANGRSAWQAAKELDASHDVLANRSFADYSWALAFFGKRDELGALLTSIENREITSHAPAFLRAQESMASMVDNTENSHLCGPHSLFCILQEQGNETPDQVFETGAKSTEQGMNFAQVAEIASDAGMPFQVARAEGATAVPVPSVISWKDGHFSAVVRETPSGKVVVEDSMFRQPLIIDPAALLTQSSGYFLVPEEAIGSDWVAVSETEAATVWGAHTPVFPNPDDKLPCPDCSGCGMAVFSVDELHCDLRLTDTPLLYQPAFGPNVSPTFTYNYLSTNQPDTFYFSNIGPNWNLNWISFIVDDPNNPEANVFYFQPNGGGGRHFVNDGTGNFARDQRTLSDLTRLEDGSYTLDHRDGSKEIFAQSDNGTVQRRFFRTAYTDPQGNTIQYNYDNQLRLTSIVDATGKSTTIAYDLATDPLKITAISDPYGRTARLTYDAQGRLSSITDVIDITSSFTYRSDGFVEKLTTPYGNTNFQFVAAGSNRTLTVEMPNGDHQRWRHYLFSGPAEVLSSRISYARPSDPLVSGGTFGPQTTFYWDRKAFHYHENDATKAVATRYLFSNGSRFDTVNVKAAVKKPLENPVYFAYPGQTNAFRTGSLDQEARTLRLLPDGSTQETRTDYNSIGNVTRIVDPIGRETVIEYAENEIDIIAFKQILTNGSEGYLAEYLEYQNHLPLTVKNAAGQITSYTYNSRGQLLTSTDPLGRVKMINYLEGGASVKGFGKPDTITSFRSDNVVSYTYDDLERVASMTRVDGYVTTYTYDNFDRLLTSAYMDGTETSYEYKDLDLVKVTDREGRSTVRQYNSIRELISSTDAEGRVNRYEWCRCGGLEELTDSLGRVTKWDLDLQGRLTKRTLPDGRSFTYTYDAVSRMISSKDPLGQECVYTYNHDNTVATKSFLNAVNATEGYSYQYDSAYNRITQVQDQYGVTSYTYHAYDGNSLGAGEIASMDGPWDNDTCVWEYDELGRLVSDKLPFSPMSMSYDLFGRVETMTDSLGTNTYIYDGVTSRVLSLERPDGFSASLTYTPRVEGFRLGTITNQHSGTGTISSFGHEYSPNGRITVLDRQLSPGGASQRFEYGYDSVDQLTSAVLSETNTNQVIESYQYRYDLVGNRLTAQKGSELSSRKHDVANQLNEEAPGGKTRVQGSVNRATSSITLGGVEAAVLPDGRFFAEVDLSTGNNELPLVVEEVDGNVTTKTLQMQVIDGQKLVHEYDLNGNLVKTERWDTVTNSFVIQREYSWDALDRLLSITRYEGTEKFRTEFGYNYSSQRVERKEHVNSIETEHVRYIWQGSRVRQRRDGTGNIAQVSYAANGELDVSAGNIKRYYTRDHLGSIRNIMDSNGNEIASYDYTPYGIRKTISGSYESEIGYTGHHYHVGGKILLTLYRAYDPLVGRWLSPDPIKEAGGLNLYAYVDGDPVNYVDSNGLTPSVKGRIVNFVFGANGGEKWKSFYRDSFGSGPTGGVMPKGIRDSLMAALRLSHPCARENGMHSWHAASNARLRRELGLFGVPLIAVGGVLHETPLDSGSFVGEFLHQGPVNHVLDSIGDLAANQLGLLIGEADSLIELSGDPISVDESTKTAADLGHWIPGPGDPDPAVGGGGGRYNGNPADAWGQGPQYP